MTLREAIKWTHYDLAYGVAWVAYYKVGRSWDAYVVYEEDYERPAAEDLEALREIVNKDSGAVILNGYYTNCGATEDGTGTLQNLEAGVRWNYHNRYNLVSDYILSRS